MLTRRLSLRRRHLDVPPPAAGKDWYLYGRGLGVRVDLDAEGYARFYPSHPDAGTSRYGTGYAASDQVALVVSPPSNGAGVQATRFTDKALFPSSPSQSSLVPTAPNLVSNVVLRDRVVMVNGRELRWYPWSTTRGTSLILDTRFDNLSQSARSYSNGGHHLFVLRQGDAFESSVRGIAGDFSVYPGLSGSVYFGTDEASPILDTMLYARVASDVGAGVEYIGMPDDERARIYVPPGAEDGDIWLRHATLDITGACSHRDDVYITVTHQYREIRRGADGEPVGGITRARMSMVKGRVNLLLKIGPDGTATVANVISRTVFYAPWAYYPLIEKPGNFELRINKYGDGVTVEDFPSVEIQPHPQYYDIETSRIYTLRRYGEFILYPAYIFNQETGKTVGKLTRVRVGADGAANVAYVGILPPGSIDTFVPLENHGLLALTMEDTSGPSSVLRYYQSADMGETWSERPSYSGSPYIIRSADELLPF